MEVRGIASPRILPTPLVGLCKPGNSLIVVVSPLRSDQSHLSSFLDRLHPFVDHQFAIDILDVKLDCVQAEEELLPNLFIGLPGSQKI